MGRMKKSQVGIRISSEPITTGKVRDAERPLHILYMGPLLSRAAWLQQQVGNAYPVSVDKNSFAHVMQSISPTLRLEVPDNLSGALKSLEIDLSFPALKAFRPEGVVAQVPALQRMLQTRTLIRQVREGKQRMEEFSAKAQEAGVDPDLAKRFATALKRTTRPAVGATRSAPPATAPAKSDGAGRLESLLGMVDLGGDAEPAPAQPSAMDALMTAVTADGTGPGDVDVAVAETLIAQLDQIIGEQVTAIIHHEEFRQLEASWRSAKMLVDRIDFRKNVVFSIVPCTRDNVVESLDAWITQPSLKKSHHLLAEAPVSAIVLDMTFGCSTAEVASLANIARQTESIGAVCLTGAAPAFFGKGSASKLASLPPIWQLLQQPEYAYWNSLRKTEEFRTLGLVLPRFLLRSLYGKDDPVKEFSFTEMSEGKRPEELGLWGEGALLVAVGIAGLFAQDGWSLQFRGLHAGPRIEHLPLWDHGPREGFHPLEILIPSDKQAELSEAGFLVLSSRANDDGAYVASAPMFWQK